MGGESGFGIEDEDVKEPLIRDLLSAIEERQPGEAVELRVLRRCDPRRAETVTARLVSRDDLRKQATSTAPARFDRDPIRSIFRR